jgi:cytochrome b561
MPSTETTSYTTTAKILHWLIALAIIFMLALGWSFSFLPNGETKFTLFQLHKSIGITILVLSLLRLIWRLTHKAPPLPTTMPKWEQAAAHIGHFLLYVVMIGMPLSGWAMVSASPHNIPTILFGVVPWPALPVLSTIDNKQEVSHALNGVHGTVAYILAALVVGHAAAALKHHFISRDDILLRMAPSSCTRILNRLRGKV